MEIREHIVDFNTYCQNCKFKEKEATFAPFYKTISDDYKKAKVLKIGGKK